MKAGLDRPLGRHLLTETARLIDVPSVSGDEGALADLVEADLRALRHLTVHRIGNTVVARSTPDGAAGRLLLGGHLDTVPPIDPPQPLVLDLAAETVSGRGAVDMKGGVAIMLTLARVVLPASPLACTLVFYEREELGSHGSGMRTLADRHADLLAADAAIMLEPTGTWVEAGCQGSMRVRATYRGRAAHTARPWQGVNAIRRSAPALHRAVDHRVTEVVMDGFRYPQAFEVVAVSAGHGGNTVPDRCEIEVNMRYAPARGRAEVLAELRELFADADDVAVTLDSPAAPPSVDAPLLAPLCRRPGIRIRPKLGWTDVGRLAQLGIPAVNFGPGDPELAHGPAEVVTGADLVAGYAGIEAILA